MKSLADLVSIGEKMKTERERRSAKGEIRVEVAMSTCGITAGAAEVLEEVLHILKEKELHNVVVAKTGCPGLCFYEPLLTVEHPGEKKRVYGRVTRDRVEKLIEEDVLRNHPVAEWLINKEVQEL